MSAKTPSERERQLKWLRETYRQVAERPIQGPLGAHGLTLLAMAIQLLENGWDERTRQAIADEKSRA